LGDLVRADPGPTEPGAKAMWNLGAEYFDSAKILFENKGGISPAGPVNYLIAHSFELFVKAYLKSKGLNYNDLKKMGHSIEKMLKKCSELGMDISQEELIMAGVICNLSKHDMQRYPMLGFFSIGPIEFAEPSSLMTHVEMFANKVRLLIDEKQKGLLNVKNQ